MLKKITRISLASSKIKPEEDGKVASSASWLIECQDAFRVPILVDGAGGTNDNGHQCAPVPSPAFNIGKRNEMICLGGEPGIPSSRLNC